MDTTDHVLLIILTSLLSLFFVLCIAAVVVVIKLLSVAKGIINRADEVLVSVENATESASEVFRHTNNRKAIFSAVKTIYNLSQKGKK